jgi:hypothetical protein
MNSAKGGRSAAADEIFQTDVANEVKRARRKFPSSALALAALTEEVGELAAAMLKARAGDAAAAANVWAEAIQVAAMAQRVAVEGDPSFDLVNYADPGISQ